MASAQDDAASASMAFMNQLLLDLAPDSRPTLGGFVPGRNAELLGVLQSLAAGAGTERFLYLWGESGSGRSHLLRATMEAFSGNGLPACYLRGSEALEFPPELEQLRCVAVDDVHCLGTASQEALFHLHNRMREGGRAVLLVAGDAAPAGLTLREDLLTRLSWGLVYQVHRLSDEEKSRVLVGRAAARGFVLPREVSEYLLRHGRRDLPWLVSVVDALDRYSLQTKRPVTLPLLKEIIQASLDFPGPA
jgi:DnaA-homolog protein